MGEQPWVIEYAVIDSLHMNAVIGDLEPGESALSPRVVDRIGAYGMLQFHTMWEVPKVRDNATAELIEAYNTYEREVIDEMETPPDRRYQQVHQGHLTALQPGERALLDDQRLRANSLTGPADMLLDEIRALEAAGVNNVTLWAPPGKVRETIAEFSQEIIAKL